MACLVGSGGVAGALPLAWRRIVTAAAASPFDHGWMVLAVLLLMGALVLPFGLISGFLQRPRWPASAGQTVVVGAVSFVAPGLLEELLFRVLVLPGREEDFGWLTALSMLFVFTVVYHMDAIHREHEVFDDWRFLCAALAIGVACTLVYTRTGSWWLAAVVHWLPVWTWLSFFGGKERIDQTKIDQASVA